MNEKHVFIIGVDQFNLDRMQRLPEAASITFHAALHFDEIRGVEEISISKLLAIAYQRIEEVGKIDAIVSYYDFPGTVLVPIIAEKYNLPGPSLQSVLKCEHKYWSRLEQQKVIPRSIPQFCAFDPFDPNSYDTIDFIPPFWIKPIKSYRSFLAYRVNEPVQHKEYMEEVCKHVNFIAEPFNYILKNYNVPREIADMKETMIAETTIGGHQCTVEGYALEDEVVVYGIVDSVREEDRSSFSRYEYPSGLPQEIQFRMADLSRRVISQIGLTNSPFNIEFFYDNTANNIFLLEINPRISQAHSDIFEKVHGNSHHQIMLNLALGKRPRALEYNGDFRIAAHFMLRTFENGRINRAPNQEEINKLKQKYPELAIKINVKEGMMLKDMYGQDSYSYEVANIYLGGKNQEEMLEKYHDLVSQLNFDIAYVKSEMLY